MHKVLLTGFGPFKEHTVNPSQAIAERLNGEQIGGAAITGIDSIDLEMFAINHRFGRSEPELVPIVDGGPAAYFATIDIDGIVRSASPQSSIQIHRHGYAGSYLATTSSTRPCTTPPSTRTSTKLDSFTSL